MSDEATDLYEPWSSEGCSLAAALRRVADPASLIAGHTLVEAFQRFVLEDPEVAALSNEATRRHPEWREVLIEGRFLGPNRWRLGVRHPFSFFTDRDLSPIGILSDPPPRSVRLAFGALNDRAEALFDLLRHGSLRGVGVPASANLAPNIQRSLWSHRDFAIDLDTGDLMEQNPNCEDPPYDSYLKRWSGVVLEEPEGKTQGPPEDHARMAEPAGSLKQRPTIHAESQCTDWLIEQMGLHPDRSPKPKSEWWAEAIDLYGHELSHRSFDRAWDAAVRATGSNWNKPGRRKGGN